jgi:hypothetical protein
LASVLLVPPDGAFRHGPRVSVDWAWIEAKGSQSRLDFPRFVASQWGLARRHLGKCLLAVSRPRRLHGRRHEGGYVGDVYRRRRRWCRRGRRGVRQSWYRCSDRYGEE